MDLTRLYCSSAENTSERKYDARHFNKSKQDVDENKLSEATKAMKTDQNMYLVLQI